MKNISLLLFFLFVSCMKPDCEYLAKRAKNRECLLIFEQYPVFENYKLDAKGKHLITKKECTCSDEGRWWSQYSSFIAKGDTIIKRKGELIFSIHKKDTILSFNWHCEGKTYK